MKTQKRRPAHLKFYRRENFDDLRGKTKEDVINELKEFGRELLSEFSRERRKRMEQLENGGMDEPGNQEAGRKKKS